MALPTISTSSPNSDAQSLSTNIPRIAVAFAAAMTTGGTTYAFGLYGDALKKSLHLSQSQLDTISTAFFVSGIFSWIPGLIVDRKGTKFGIICGGLLGCTCLTSYWMVATLRVKLQTHSLLVTTLSILGIFIFASCALITGSVFKVLVANCPTSKGSAVGVAKGFVGLGSGVYAMLFESLGLPSTLDFLPMCGVLFVVAAVIPAVFVLPSKQNFVAVPDVTTPLHFQIMYISLVVLATLIVGTSLLSLKQENNESDGSDDNSRTHPRHGHDYRITFLLLLAWIGPIVSLLYLPQRALTTNSLEAIPEEQHNHETESDDEEQEELHGLLEGSSESNNSHSDTLSQRSKSKVIQQQGEVDLGASITSVHSTTSQRAADDDENNEDQLQEDAFQDEEDDIELEMIESDNAPGHGSSMAGATSGSNSSRSSNDKNLSQMLTTPSAWFLLWTCTIVVGGGTVETNNLGQMTESLRLPESVTPAALALFSVAQSFGRVLTGSVSEAALHSSYYTPRPVFLIAACAVGILAHLILSAATAQAPFLIGIMLSGMAFGMVWPLMVLIVEEVFGTANVAANYMFFDGFCSAAGTVLLSKGVAQYVYESHIDFNNDNNEEGDNPSSCYGLECFRATHQVIALLTLTGVATSWGMVVTSRHAYQKPPVHRM